MEIRIGTIGDPAVAALLGEHRERMREYSPPESIHALTASELGEPSVTLWCAWDGSELLGCGALKAIDPLHGEIKSMRTADAHLRKGVAEALLLQLIRDAQSRGMARLSLETGSHAAFLPAQNLYRKHGFEACEPFASYVVDPYSVYMTRVL